MQYDHQYLHCKHWLLRIQHGLRQQSNHHGFAVLSGNVTANCHQLALQQTAWVWQGALNLPHEPSEIEISKDVYLWYIYDFNMCINIERDYMILYTKKSRKPTLPAIPNFKYPWIKLAISGGFFWWDMYARFKKWFIFNSGLSIDLAIHIP